LIKDGLELKIMVSGVLTHDAFECSRCGVCCKKQKVVLLTLFDIFRLSQRLGIKPGEFFKKYCLKSSKFQSEGRTRLYLRALGGCPFLKENMCSVQDVKPVVCAQNPFYYPEASLAAYKVFGILEDECNINQFPYDTIAKGDDEKLIEMDILVQSMEDYMERYGRFDEATAAPYLDQSLKDLKDPRVRAMTYTRILDQSIRREDMCRTDPYFKGAANMYISGFYKDFKRAVELASKNGGVVAFEPSALGTIGGVMALVLFEKDYNEVKKALSRSGGADIHVSPFEFEDKEYSTVSIDSGKKVIFYYHIEPDEKKALRHEPGEIMIEFKNEKGGKFIFTGRDADRWLA
jgi:uncharacterized protein